MPLAADEALLRGAAWLSLAGWALGEWWRSGALGGLGRARLAWTLGAGLKWFSSDGVGVRLQARYAPAHLNDASSDFCDPFGFCQGWLHQLEFMGGVAVRF